MLNIIVFGDINIDSMFQLAIKIILPYPYQTFFLNLGHQAVGDFPDEFDIFSDFRLNVHKYIKCLVIVFFTRWRSGPKEAYRR